MNRYKDRVEQILKECFILESPIPIIDIAHIYKFVVVEADLDNDESGFLMIDDEGIKIGEKIETRIICVNRTDSPLRKRFTIAHELGHYFLEIQEKEPISHFLVHREDKDCLDRKKEREADLFASEILIPTRFLEAFIQKLTQTELLLNNVSDYISKHFQVSKSCAEIRYERYCRGD